MGKMNDCSGWLLDRAMTIVKKCSEGNFDMLDDRACLHIFFLATDPVQQIFNEDASAHSSTELSKSFSSTRSCSERLQFGVS